jgi:transposase
LADVAVGSRRVALIVTARKFRCEGAGCDRRLFCERLDGLADARARTTARLGDLHRPLGFAPGGEPGSRVAAELAIPTSPDTVLRRVVATANAPEPIYRYVGIDDFALRKGQVYGTLLIDLEGGRVIDLLDGRDGTAVQAWLKAHPGVEVITRDRWTAYANAATVGAPAATPVADRFHLVTNLREVVEKVLDAHQSAVVAALLKVAESATGPTPLRSGEPLPTAVPRPPSARDARFAEVKRLRTAGMGVRRIARQMGLSVATVRRYLRSERCPAGNRGRLRPTHLDRYADRVDDYLRRGGRNAAEVHRQLRADGVRTSRASVQRFVTRRLMALGGSPKRGTTESPPAPRVSMRQLSFECVRRAETRREVEAARVTAARGVAEVAAACALVDEFLGMVRKAVTTPLADRLARAERSSSPAVRSFAASLRTDEAAVAAGLTTTWSNGPVEGHVHRLKLIKRQMYGRAGFRLLRARVRHKP